MTNYHIGLDFGTSQTKICLLNKNSGVREFVKFENDNYFLPSIIVKKEDNTFSYGNESVNGTKYRYFKMAAAEDEHLIQITNENLGGNLQHGTIDDFRKYSNDYQIKSEILVVLYLTYTFLFVKKQKQEHNIKKIYGRLIGRILGNNTARENTYSINLGIPTEWNNPNQIRRKVKFQSILIAAVELANQFENLESYLSKNDVDLLKNISKINENYLLELENIEDFQKEKKVKEWLEKYKLSVYPESAAGVNYLLKTGRLANGSYGTLDIGAGTSDIAIFEVQNNILKRYYCSESVEIASNDFYRVYAKQFFDKESITFENIREIENVIINNIDVNDDFYNNARNNVRGFHGNNGIEFTIRKTFYRKYYMPFYQQNPIEAYRVKNEVLNEKPVIVFGGGANLEGFCDGKYCFFLGNHIFGYHDRYFVSRPITDFVNQVDIVDEDLVKPSINLLILALGLTYTDLNDDDNNSIHFVIPVDDFPRYEPSIKDRFFYYDLQDAVYK